MPLVSAVTPVLSARESVSSPRLGGPRNRAARLLRVLLALGAAISFAGPARAQPASASARSGLSMEPLAPRSGSRGPTMFVVVPPGESGVRTENPYDDPAMWGRRYREIEVGAIGTGVTIGDYDGDGRPDLFVVNKTGSCRLFRNLGGFKFEDVTAKAGVGEVGDAAKIWKQGATFADVNNDGRLDLYVCRFDAPNLLYINQGDGTFREEAHARGLDVKGASSMAAFADYDRDGWLDVFVQTNLLDPAAHPDGQRDHLFHNNGDGTFTDVTDRAGVAPQPTHGNSAVWWDFDDDGWPDLYVANDFDEPDRLFHNNRDGTFTDVIAQVVPHVPYSSMGADLGDIDNDGRIDFIASDMAATSRESDQRTMAETRARREDPRPGSHEVIQFPRNAVFLNTGTGRCLEAAQLAGLDATDWTWSLRWEDLDNDGRLDLYVPNGMYREIHNVDLLARRMSADSDLARVRIARASPVFAETHLAYRNEGNLHFRSVGPAWGLDQKAVSFGAAFGDLDGDGDLDLLYSNYQAGATLLRNDCDTGHRVVIALRGTRSNRFGIGAKVRLETETGTQARELSLARGYMSSSEPIVHFGLGDDTTIRRLVVTWPGGTVQTFTDLPVDRRFVITEPTEPAPPAPPVQPASSAQFEEASHALGLDLSSREDEVDEFANQPLLPWRFNRRGPALAAGDLDGSGRDGLCLGGTTRDPVRVLVRGANGKFQPVEAAGLATAATVDDGPVLLFDARGEGKMDLLVTRGGSALPTESPDYQPQLWFNDGHGHFTRAPDGALPSLPISAGTAVAADFDHDGRLDVFIGGRVSPGDYPAVPRSALLANRGGHFEDVTDQLAPALRQPGLVTAALWSDVDADGWPDLLLALEWGEVKYFHNQQGRGFEDWTERSGFSDTGSGWWRSIAAGDFNGDGRLDYVVGNAGLNTPYRASRDEPAVLFAGDFGGRMPNELIEARTDTGVLYPRRSRLELSAANPAIRVRFPQNDVYARSSLAEVFGRNRLDAAERMTATELRSGILLSQPDGRYRFEPLPRIAQIAPFDGTVVGDFDGDGAQDIYAGQNSYAPAPAIGRFDGGLSQLLRGDGHGHFEPVGPAESGLVVPGDAKAAVMVDLDDDGWPDLVVARNNDTVVSFRNRGVAGHHSLRISLAGPKGNPTGVGARIVAEYADGHRVTAEVCAGSGYYSQSGAAIYVGYSRENPVKRIRAKWPQGGETIREITADTPNSIVITRN